VVAAHLQLLDGARALLRGGSLILHFEFNYSSLFEHLSIKR
jgi:hypothetical protein